MDTARRGYGVDSEPGVRAFDLAFFPPTAAGFTSVDAVNALLYTARCDCYLRERAQMT